MRRDPFTELDENYPDRQVRRVPMPEDHLGLTDHERRIVWISDDLTVDEERCTLAHEIEHIRRGDHEPCDARHELDIERLAARWLIDLDDLLDVATWTNDPGEAAAELGVDLDILRARIEALRPCERSALLRRVEARRTAA